MSRQRPIVAGGRAPAVEGPKREQRSKDRRNSFQRAMVDTLTGGRQECIVSDYSETGCRIRLNGAENLPFVVEIIIPMLGVKRMAERCWSEPRDAGYRFI